MPALNFLALGDKTAFILYGRMTICYDGRASSTIGPTNLMLIHKSDGSVIIHGGDLVKPRNYMSPKTLMAYSADGNCLVFTRKTESIKVILDKVNIADALVLEDWSLDKITITKTEAELVDKLVASPRVYFKFNPGEMIREFRTEHGPVDLALFESPLVSYLPWQPGSPPPPDMDTPIIHAVEVKRKKATLNNCHQLVKYAECLMEDGWAVVSWIAAPGISDNARTYCDKHNIRYAYVGF